MCIRDRAWIGRMFDDAAQQLQSRRRGKAGRGNLASLGTERLGQCRMPMPDAGDPNSRYPVDEAIAIDVFEQRALSACHGQARKRRDLLDAWCQIRRFFGT